MARGDRSPGSFAREFEPSEPTIRNWVKQADLDEGLRSDGLTTEARKEMREVKRENKRLRMELLPALPLEHLGRGAAAGGDGDLVDLAGSLYWEAGSPECVLDRGNVASHLADRAEADLAEDEGVGGEGCVGDQHIRYRDPGTASRPCRDADPCRRPVPSWPRRLSRLVPG